MINSQHLRDLMQREGLSSRQVAEIVGVHPVTVRRWMTGKARVPQSALMVLDGLEKRRKA